MRMTIRHDPETGLIEVISSGGAISLSQTEAAALYTLLRRALGIRGRFMLWRHRRMFSGIVSE